MEITQPGHVSRLTANPVQSAGDLLALLNRLGAIEARVESVGRGQLVLNTQLGLIRGLNSLNLKSGDRVLIRASQDEQSPVLKVTPLPARPISLKLDQIPKLAAQVAGGKAVTGLLLENGARNSLVKLGEQRITLTRLPGIRAGQLIEFLGSADNKRVEIRPLDHREVLKHALMRLLPLAPAPGQPSAMTRLVRFAGQLNATPPQAATPSAQAAGAGTEKDKVPIEILKLLRPLLATIPRAMNIERNAIQHWIQGTFHKGPPEPGTGTRTPTDRVARETPGSRISPEAVLRQIVNLARTREGQGGNRGDERNLPDSRLLAARELGMLAEQSLGQLLLQKTNLRYQQETQQPWGINLAVPFIDDEKSGELRLSIGESGRDNDAESPGWEVHLAFEFGQLGLITTRLLLDGNRLSASFWSELPETRDRIERNLGLFSRQISRTGLVPGDFNSFAGPPPESPAHPTLPGSENLLDIEV